MLADNTKISHKGRLCVTLVALSFLLFYVISDKLIGNVNFCLGIKSVGENYVPASILLDNIKNLTINQSQVIAIFSKNKDETIYTNIKHVAKGINLHNVLLPLDINELISLEKYIPKK